MDSNGASTKFSALSTSPTGGFPESALIFFRKKYLNIFIFMLWPFKYTCFKMNRPNQRCNWLFVIIMSLSVCILLEPSIVEYSANWGWLAWKYLMKLAHAMFLVQSTPSPFNDFYPTSLFYLVYYSQVLLCPPTHFYSSIFFVLERI